MPEEGSFVVAAHRAGTAAAACWEAGRDVGSVAGQEPWDSSGDAGEDNWVGDPAEWVVVVVVVVDVEAAAVD